MPRFDHPAGDEMHRLRIEAGRLRTQLDNERAAHQVTCQERDEGARWRRQGEAELRGEIECLRAALLRHGNHIVECMSRRGGECSCGWPTLFDSEIKKRRSHEQEGRRSHERL